MTLAGVPNGFVRLARVLSVESAMPSPHVADSLTRSKRTRSLPPTPDAAPSLETDSAAERSS
jgi:hypothetical protein